MATEKRGAEATELEERTSPAKVTKTAEDQKDISAAAKKAAPVEPVPLENGKEKGKVTEQAEEKPDTEPTAAAATDDATAEAKEAKAQPDESLAKPATEPVADEAVKTKPPGETDEPAPTAQEA